MSLRRQWMKYVTIDVLCWTITILVRCKVGLKSFVVLVDYRDYMGSSLETWLSARSFLHLNSYKLVSSVTAGIGARFSVKCIVCVLKIKEILNKLYKTAPKVCQWSNPPCPYKDIRWLYKYWLGVLILHLRKYSCMDVWWPHYATLWSNGRGCLHMWISHICR